MRAGGSSPGRAARAISRRANQPCAAVNPGEEIGEATIEVTGSLRSNRTMTTATAPAPNLDSLRERFRGELITPDDSAYDERRKLFNAIHDKHPAVIARCAGTADVVAAVRYARETDLEIAVRSGARHMVGFGVDGRWPRDRPVGDAGGEGR